MSIAIATNGQQIERALILAAAGQAVRYLAGIRDRRVAPNPDAVKRLEELGGPLPDSETDPAIVLKMLDEIGSPATVANAGGRYFGFVNGGAIPVTRAANVLAGAWDQNAALRVMSPTAAAVEDISLAWVTELLSL